ncbi:MAG: DNA mismatch repair endonuclease MutL [Oscillospiraceae bacterium]|nr:DNA mismatch repair endonuclease MutL [Oscillospiraceae bacterium]
MKIIELDPHVADLIAAGEVVERPSSVIKELVENAIDAGASAVTAEIKNGGMSYMRVTDDGCGMARGDVRTAFLRHATSKLRDERGLEAIGTLGFRGEALAAIASVSRVEVLTRERGADEGTALTLEGGAPSGAEPAGCPEGTTVIVRDLFFNTPARLKFMKTDRAEGSAVTAAIISCALSRPSVSVKYIKDGREECHTPGDGRAESCVYTVFGREFAAGLTRCRSSYDGVEVTGFVSMPGAARGNRGHQYFFVNGRCVKSKTLQAALEQAYSNSLFSGRFPACVLYITLAANLVDVNVHPAKTEVRFLYEKSVFSAVRLAALAALDGGGAGAVPAVSARTRELAGAPPPAPTAASREGSRAQYPPPQESAGVGEPERVYIATQADARDAARRSPAPRDRDVRLEWPGEAPGAPAQMQCMPQAADYRVIGEALDTYIVAEYKSSLWLIDKHAAHERVNFDAMKAEGYAAMPQALITPLIFRYGARDVQLLLENAGALEALGFEAESFGEDTLAIRALPSDMDVGDARAALEEICEQLRAGGMDEDARRDAVLRTLACKSAIKAGRRHDALELEALAKRVFSGEVRYCPHGRPVAVELTQSSLEKQFLRK